MPLSDGRIVYSYPVGVFAPLDYQSSFVGCCEFLLLLLKVPEQRDFVFRQRLPEFFINNAGRSIHEQSVLDNPEAHIPPAQIFEQRRRTQISNSTRSLEEGCDSPP